MRRRLTTAAIAAMLAATGVATAQDPDFAATANGLCAQTAHLARRAHPRTHAAITRRARRLLTAEGKLYARLEALTPPPGQLTLWSETTPAFAKLQAAGKSFIIAYAHHDDHRLVRSALQLGRLTAKVATRFGQLGLTTCERAYRTGELP